MIITDNNTTDLDILLNKNYQFSGYDFREYKRGTVTRRLERRLYATGTKTYQDYMQFLNTHPEEYGILAEYLTIKTSGFFRSQYTFQQVSSLVLPELVAYKRSQKKRQLLIWSTACARGEEPYSIAILCSEFLNHSLPDFDVKVYATDVSRHALEEAKAGIYSAKDLESLTTPLLERYFSHHSETYKVRNSIRQMLHFFYFDLASNIEPPFINMDCIFCCNVLIYLQQKLQEKVLGILYDSLANPGYLILGEAETPTNNLREKLHCLNIKARIYKKESD